MEAETCFGKVHDVVRVEAIPRSRLVPGAVILARVPFAEGDGSYKCRPVIVVQVVGSMVEVRPCTSSTNALRRFDTVTVADLAVAGLSKPTGVRSRSVRVDPMDLVQYLGRLSEPDACRVLGMFATAARMAA